MGIARICDLDNARFPAFAKLGVQAKWKISCELARYGWRPLDVSPSENLSPEADCAIRQEATAESKHNFLYSPDSVGWA
jgi:hypothetical protein